MRFDINKKENIQGQEFALSPLGKEYFITAILNVSGNISDLINRCLKKLV
jgi:alkyl hydroperoxide reductase subunit AhpF